MQMPNDLTGKILQRLYKRGVNPEFMYDIEFFHIFSDQASAEAMAKQVRESGAQSDVEHDEVEGKWDCTVVLQMLPTYDNVRRAERDLDQIARQLGGRGDGWGMMH
jgi:regulator of RNase E activity RraB